MITAPEIPLDIREAMRDCILAIFWPKKKIVEFLISVGCPENAVAAPDTILKRHEIIDDAFRQLLNRADKGHSIFQVMIDRLANWAYFDSYYFDTIKKLDQATAEAKIKSLKEAIDRRNAKTIVRRTKTSDAREKQTKTADLQALHKAFSKMFGSEMTPQARGKFFETFLRELFNRQSIKMGDHFCLKGEEIDGTFKFDGENYIVEAKWQEASVSTNQLYHFALKVDGKMHGRGLFISVNAFSKDAIKAIVHGKHIQTILMDGEDLSHVLDDRITLENLLDYKIRAAQTKGEIYVCALRQASKV